MLDRKIQKVDVSFIFSASDSGDLSHLAKPSVKLAWKDFVELVSARMPDGEEGVSVHLYGRPSL
jgi:hypothetical protein